MNQNRTPIDFKEVSKNMGVSKIGFFHAKSSILIEFSIVFTIHFGGFPPIFGGPPIYSRLHFPKLGWFQLLSSTLEVEPPFRRCGRGPHNTPKTHTANGDVFQAMTHDSIHGEWVWYIYIPEFGAGFLWWSTLPETNQNAPENRPSQKETSIPTIHFQGRTGC